MSKLRNRYWISTRPLFLGVILQACGGPVTEPGGVTGRDAGPPSAEVKCTESSCNYSTEFCVASGGATHCYARPGLLSLQSCLGWCDCIGQINWQDKSECMRGFWSCRQQFNSFTVSCGS
jgi:hypothetical protein